MIKLRSLSGATWTTFSSNINKVFPPAWGETVALFPRDSYCANGAPVACELYFAFSCCIWLLVSGGQTWCHGLLFWGLLVLVVDMDVLRWQVFWNEERCRNEHELAVLVCCRFSLQPDMQSGVSSVGFSVIPPIMGPLSQTIPIPLQ